MSTLRVRCLGGFEVWHGDGQVSGFESQKTKALLAYLLSHRGRSLTRDHLAGLLWPERDDESARRNLRQAVYSLKRALPQPGTPAILAHDGQLRIHPDFDCWYDVAAFDRELGIAGAGDPPDPHGLANAVALYRGDFLAGFQVRDSEAFELWLVTEQERLKEKVLEALRNLVEGYVARGEVRFGVQYARRLMAIDPLAEEAYRYLMQLHALSGRRSQALAQYAELRELLRASMDVEPMPETEALYQAILRDETPARLSSGGDEPIGPLVPLVGRQDAYQELQRCWQSVLRGRARLTLVGGEAGVGKSRLVKSFLDGAGSQHDAVVLTGRCFAQGSALYQPFSQVFQNAVTCDAPGVEEALRQAPPQLLAELAPLVPGMRHLRPDVPPPDAAAPVPDGRRRLFDAAARLLEILLAGVDSGGRSGVLVIFLDNLHLAGPESLVLLRHLRARLAGTPTWIVAAYRNDALAGDHPVRELEGDAESDAAVTRMTVEPLPPAAVEELAGSLVRGDQAAELARFLSRSCRGLPMAIAEAINHLWDEGVLVPAKGGRWRVAGALDEVDLPDSRSFHDLVARRFHRLPSSTRRLAALGAVMGQKFDVELLREAAAELPSVVEIGLEVLLERWLVRRSAESWVTGGREHCLVLFARGARRGSFEFAHELTWRAIYEQLDPRRRSIMHAEIAAALARLDRDAARSGALCETLAYHFTAAGRWDRALPHLRQAAGRARALGAWAAALAYDDRSLAALDHLIAAAGEGRQAEPWRQQRVQVALSRDELASRQDNAGSMAEPAAAAMSAGS